MVGEEYRHGFSFVLGHLFSSQGREMVCTGEVGDLEEAPSSLDRMASSRRFRFACRVLGVCIILPSIAFLVLGSATQASWLGLQSASRPRFKEAAEVAATQEESWLDFIATNLLGLLPLGVLPIVPSPMLWPPPAPPSPSRFSLPSFCVNKLSASSIPLVDADVEPSTQLWVLSSLGGQLLGKTAVVFHSRQPEWEESVCSQGPSAGLCFELYHVPEGGQALQTLSHSCVGKKQISMGLGSELQTIAMSSGVKLEFRLEFARPPLTSDSPRHPTTPSPSPPPQMRAAKERVAEINARFRNGHPSNELKTAGVLVRQFDNLNDDSKPWLPCPETLWCADYADRYAATIINSRVQQLFYALGKGGIVLAPTVSMFCAYPEDGNSMDTAKTCHPLGGDGGSCIPGCYPVGQTCTELGREWSCSYLPTELRQAMEAQENRADFKVRNNEVVVDAASVVDQLPNSIAGFYITTADGSARAIHTQFLNEYGLTNETGPPLMRLNLPDEGNGNGPFSLVET